MRRNTVISHNNLFYRCDSLGNIQCALELTVTLLSPSFSWLPKTSSVCEPCSTWLTATEPCWAPPGSWYWLPSRYYNHLQPHAYLLATTHICTHSHVIRRHIQIHFMYKCTKLFLHCLHCALSTSQRESGIILSTFTKKYMSFSMLVYFFKTWYELFFNSPSPSVFLPALSVDPRA